MKRTLTSIISIISVTSLLSLGGGARAQADCTNASLKGTYGITCEGALGGSPAAEVGIATYDGKGKVSGKSTISINGTILKDVPFEGTYTLNADCTGTIFGTLGNLNLSLHFVLVDGGREIYFIIASIPRSLVVYGVRKKISQDE